MNRMAWMLAPERRATVLVSVILLASWPLLPLDGLAREDLLPWTALSFTLPAIWVGAPFGAGAHPQLNVRSTFRGRWLIRLSVLAAAIALFLVVEASRTADLTTAVAAFVGVSAFAGCRYIAREDGSTAWTPHGPPVVQPWIFGSVAFLVAAVVVGQLATIPSVAIVSRALFAGLVLLATGLIWGRVQNARQQRAMGNGPPWQRAVIAFLAPVVAVSVCAMAADSQLTVQAWLLALLGGAVSQAIWPVRELAGAACFLHELEPVSEVEADSHGSATASTTPPRGTLRFRPHKARRTRVMHPWVVAAPATEQARTPVTRLWRRGVTPREDHVLGTPMLSSPKGVASLPMVQIDIADSEDTRPLRPGDTRERRLVVVYPNGAPGGIQSTERPTFAWETRATVSSMVEVDAATKTLVLEQGAVLVIGTESSTTLYELEIGVAIYEDEALIGQSTPRFQDYVPQ